MRFTSWRTILAVGALLTASVLAPAALAQCGLAGKAVTPASWRSAVGNPRVLLADESERSPTIVGMWHVVFTAHTMNGSAIPDTQIDNAIVVFHDDGTEIMNSGRPAQDGNFCLGVWERTGRLAYFVNHIPWGGNDTTNAPSGIGNPTAGSQIVEQITLSLDGKSYSGSFSLDAYDAQGHLSVSFTGQLKATRVTVSTPFSSLL